MSCTDEDYEDDVVDCPSIPVSVSQYCRLRSGKRGRIVKAAQAIPSPGTTVLRDDPFAAVVSDTYRSVCCACCLHVCTTQIFVCGGCSVTFYCSTECIARDGALVHTGLECQALKKLNAMGVEGDSQAMRLALRLACLAKKKEDAVVDRTSSSNTTPAPPVFHSPAFIFTLEDHYDNVMQDLAVRRGILAVAEALSSFLNSSSGTSTTITAPTSRKEIASLLLTIQCNAHGIRNSLGQMLGLGLFPLASMLNHSCLPSCHHVFSLHPGQGPPTLTFKTLRPIQEGEELVYSYTDLMRPGGMRREILGRAYSFTCACARCLITLGGGIGEGGGKREAMGSSGLANALTEWALESPACDSPGCVGALCSLQGEVKEVEEDGNGDDKERYEPSECSMWKCLECGKQEETAEVQSKLIAATTLLQACLFALQEEQQQQQQQQQQPHNGGGIAALPAMPLSDAAYSLASHLFGSNPPLRLHVRHWLVYHALTSLSQHLMPAMTATHAGERGEEKTELSTGGEGEEVAWLRAACEVWMLCNLWRLSGWIEGKSKDAKEINYYPELGQRLVATGKALLDYRASTGGSKKFEEEKKCGAWRLPAVYHEFNDVIVRGPQALLHLGQKILRASNY